MLPVFMRVIARTPSDDPGRACDVHNPLTCVGGLRLCLCMLMYMRECVLTFTFLCARTGRGVPGPDSQSAPRGQISMHGRHVAVAACPAACRRIELCAAVGIHGIAASGRQLADAFESRLNDLDRMLCRQYETASDTLMVKRSAPRGLLALSTGSTFVLCCRLRCRRPSSADIELVLVI